MKAETDCPEDDGLGQEKDNLIPLTFRRLASEHAELIGKALVEKAKGGHYNSAHLLLELGGISLPRGEKTDKKTGDVEPRIFLLDLVDKILLRKDAAE